MKKKFYAMHVKFKNIMSHIYLDDLNHNKQINRTIFPQCMDAVLSRFHNKMPPEYLGQQQHGWIYHPQYT